MQEKKQDFQMFKKKVERENIQTLQSKFAKTQIIRGLYLLNVNSRA